MHVCLQKPLKSRWPHAGKSARHITLPHCSLSLAQPHTGARTHVRVQSPSISFQWVPSTLQSEYLRDLGRKRFNGVMRESSRKNVQIAFESSDAAPWLKPARWVHRQRLDSYASCNAQVKPCACLIWIFLFFFWLHNMHMFRVINKSKQTDALVYTSLSIGEKDYSHCSSNSCSFSQLWLKKVTFTKALKVKVRIKNREKDKSGKPFMVWVKLARVMDPQQVSDSST